MLQPSCDITPLLEVCLQGPSIDGPRVLAKLDSKVGIVVFAHHAQAAAAQNPLPPLRPIHAVVANAPLDTFPMLLPS